MIIIRTSHQSQTQKSTSKCTTLGSGQTAPPCMTKDDINVVVQGQHRGHIKGVKCQLPRVYGPSSTAGRSIDYCANPNPYRANAIPEFVHHQITGVLQSYHQYIQSYVSSVYPGFQLPPVPPTSLFVPP